jgi:Ca2+-binding EF-hand superfamily protein
MIPNKTEEQILYQQFKFYDLESSGLCTLQNFIKANDRIGVVLQKLEHFEVVFNYFADPETSLLNYRVFIHQIFNFKTDKDIYQYQVEKNEEIQQKGFVNILTEKIIQRGGTFTLIELVKNLQIADFEGNKRMNIDNFIKVLQRCKIFLNTNEMETLFNEFNFFENGIVKYQILINILLDKFWDDEKLYLSEQIYYLLTGNGRKIASLNVLKNYFDQILLNTLEKKFFLEFINEYKTINKINISQSMDLKDLVQFLKYYIFGQNDNNYLNDLLNILKSEDEKEKEQEKYNKNKQSGFKKLKQAQKQAEYEGKKINNYLGEGYENPRVNEINAKLRDKLITFGRKTLFNMLKHFKFYDNKTKFISKYDFTKILKNFNIKLPVDDVDELFKNYGIDKIRNTMDYELYLNDLILGYTSKERQNAINYIFDTIAERGKNLIKDINLTFLKDIYNGRNNYFQKDEK